MKLQGRKEVLYAPLIILQKMQVAILLDMRVSTLCVILDETSNTAS